MSHSHFLTSNTEKALNGLDDDPILNLKLAEMAVDCRFEECGMLFSVDDNSDDDPVDSVHSDNEKHDMLSSLDYYSDGSVYSDYEPKNSVHPNFEEPVEFDATLPEGPILPSNLQVFDTPSSSPRSSASSIIKTHACATFPMHRTLFDLEFTVLAPPAPVSPGQEAFLNASEKFAAKLSSDNHGLDSGDSAPEDELFEEVTVIHHDSDSENCQVVGESDQCEAVILPSISFDSIFAGRTEEIRFNKPEPLLDCYLIRARIPNYVPPNCEARIKKIYDTLAPLPEQCKPPDGSHKSSKLLVHQSQDAIRNYTEYMEQCVIQLRAVKREMKKLEALETRFMPEHRKIGKEINQSIDSGIEDISKEYFFSHRDLVSDVHIISQRRHIPTKFLARLVLKSWRGVANDVAFNVAIFLEDRETKAVRLLSKVSKLMRDSENYAHNLALERLLFFRRHSKRFDELECARLSGSLP